MKTEMYALSVYAFLLYVYCRNASFVVLSNTARIFSRSVVMFFLVKARLVEAPFCNLYGVGLTRLLAVSAL